MNTKIRLIQLKKSQKWLLEELHKIGERTVDIPTLSKIINHKLNTPLADRVRKEIDRILDEYENGKEA